MGRELQKKKNKSSLPKRRQNPKSKKKILANPIIAANWNQKETLTQNYRRLGLTARLNHATGGTEKTIALLGLNDPASSRADAPKNSTADKLNIVSRAPETAQLEEVDVERDPETGEIVRIGSGNEGERDNPLNDPLNELEDEGEGEGLGEWNGFAMVPEEQEPQANSRNPVIRQLEEQARNGVKKTPRKQSQREEEWIARLVEKYGDDCKRMVWDRKLNPMQQSEGDLRRRVRKWREGHGQG
ncbi:60S ribosomal subunit biogenesis protein-like protein Nop16 [Lindgomyces ingoldianus]|uniref:60S ribosomal subunit biogenesis protein-like protein Nop16 n=1 Tax=Lindgomyces ingoldianus TaxID=673940 RepID=A0ACB6QTU0_9PLEO|nr:60S ribosomal subunit biogenesis protein-like protein Nop16 [Lindgomyces ingoldianus]KAF2469988.1 60S ribosomal subunit biogenesis protein-like protein Nop16 [Lindgomyces ingoldianus]